MKFRRNLFARLYRNPDPEDDGSGGPGATVDPAAGAADPAAGSDAGADPAAASAGQDGGSTAPGSMLEAMFKQAQQPTADEQAEAQATGKTVQQLRDEKGRFAGKAPDGQTPPTQKPAADPNKKPEEKPGDLTQMPEGLTPKAQQRFQALANDNKEKAAMLERYEPIVQSALGMQQVFRENGVKREQFEQAMEVVGLMNRGDLRGALKVLDEQRALISMHLGEPLPGADPLANFPDLRADVDNLQLTEQRALEIARQRTVQAQIERQQSNQRQAQDTQAQQREAVANGQIAVDKFCKARMADDMDYARIEPILLKKIQEGLLHGIPPQRWAHIVEKTYVLIKETAGAARTAPTTTSATPVLRPTGGGTAQQQPRTMLEAMFGPKA